MRGRAGGLAGGGYSRARRGLAAAGSAAPFGGGPLARWQDSLRASLCLAVRSGTSRRVHAASGGRVWTSLSGPARAGPLSASLPYPAPPSRVQDWGFRAPVGIEAWLFPGASRPRSCTSHGPYPGWESCTHPQRRKLLVGERSRGSQMKVKSTEILEKGFPSKNETSPFGGLFPAFRARGMWLFT